MNQKEMKWALKSTNPINPWWNGTDFTGNVFDVKEYVTFAKAHNDLKNMIHDKFHDRVIVVPYPTKLDTKVSHFEHRA